MTEAGPHDRPPRRPWRSRRVLPGATVALAAIALVAVAGFTLRGTGGPVPGGPPGSSPGSLPAAPSTTALASSEPSTAAPTASAADPSAVAPTPSPSPSPSPSSAVVPGAGAAATRVAVPGLRIDLPVVRPSSREAFPPCNVAEYLRAFPQPGMGGVTYLYAHARTGMFLPLLTASKVHDGRSLIGRAVLVWTGDNRRYRYHVVRVRRHVSARAIPEWVYALDPNSLLLQTSETPFESGTKLLVVATLDSFEAATPAEAHPRAHPIACR